MQSAWWWLRQMSGDAAYENYLAHRRAIRKAPEAHDAAMSRAEFYADALRRRYSGISRCC